MAPFPVTCRRPMTRICFTSSRATRSRYSSTGISIGSGSFAHAGLSARQVHLRIYREDGSVEGTREINPFRVIVYADVASAGTGYYCEIGCFDDDEWTSLVRSGKAATPQGQHVRRHLRAICDAADSPELSALARYGSSDPTGGRDAGAIRRRGAGTRARDPGNGYPDEWSQLVAAAASRNGNGASASDICRASEIGPAAPQQPRSSHNGRSWGNNLAGSSWGGASGSGFGGSSPS